MNDKFVTTNKHYKLFCKECKRLVKEWGLRDWKIYYEHDEDKGNRGRCWYDVANHTATIQLSAYWESKPSKKGIKFCARHEMTHLIIANLCWIASARYCTDSELDTEKERLVRHLQSIIFKNKNEMMEVAPFKKFKI